MGDVYLADDARLKRQVALKFLPGEVAGDPARLERFEREAQIVAALNHPNIVTVHSIERDNGALFMAMDTSMVARSPRSSPAAAFPSADC